MDDPYESFRRTLRAARGSTSQREFADAIGTTDKVVSRWERGLSVPRNVGVRRALAAAGVVLPPSSANAREGV